MAIKKAKKTIAVLGPDNIYLSHCTWKRALSLMQSGKAVRLNATTIKLAQTKRQRIETKHRIIKEENRICYICNRYIPETEKATIDHMIPKSRNKRADISSNMRCCCTRCNNDKDNMTLLEYVKHMKENRDMYDYISNKRLKFLEDFAIMYEEKFDLLVHSHENNSWKRRN